MLDARDIETGLGTKALILDSKLQSGLTRTLNLNEKHSTSSLVLH